MNCVYRGEPVQKPPGHSCQLFGRCVPNQGSPKVVGCGRCKKRLELNNPDFAREWVDPLLMIDRRRETTTALRGMLAGGSAFLACGGPSANGLDLGLLNRRGCWTLTVNNMGGHYAFRPQAMLCSDPPSKFSHSIWLDPGVMKFAPTPKSRGHRSRLKRKMPDGTFKREGTTVESPNVWFYQRRSWMYPDDRFFLHDGACWGNLNSGTERTGEEKTVCTMLLAIRMLSYLGAGTIYLVGVDFRMTPKRGYSFSQGRTRGACETNNRQFRVVDGWLCRMRDAGTFKRFGLEMYNCYRESGLRAFPYAPFDEAVERAVGFVEQRPWLCCWYEKVDKCPHMNPTGVPSGLRGPGV